MDIFLLQSPLQIINAAEIIFLKENKNTNKYSYKIILFDKKDKNTNIINLKTLVFLNLQYFHKVPFSDFILFKIINFLIIRIKLINVKNVDNIFMGEFIPSQIVATANLLKKPKKWILDDGNGTIVLPEFKYKNLYFKNIRPVNNKFFSYNTFLPKTINVFTLYDIKMKKPDMVFKNQLSYLKNKIKISNSGNIVFIGCAFIEDGIMNKKNYLKYLESSFTYLKKMSKNKIIYIPHRRENININIKKILFKKFNIEIIKPELPIELFLFNGNLKIFLISGFFSAAFDTLNIITDKRKILYSFFISNKHIKSKSYKEISYRLYNKYKNDYKNILLIKNY